MKICFRCGNEFSRNDSLKRHFNRKNICDAIYLDIDGKMILEKYDEYLIQYKLLLSKNLVTISNNGGNNMDNNSDNNVKKVDTKHQRKFICEFCDKGFNHKNSYYVHKKRYCKIINVTQNKDELMQEFLEIKFNVLNIEKELKEQKEQSENNIKKYQKVKFALEKKIEKLEKQINSQVLQKQNNISENQINQSGENITNDTQNINININNYGEEDILKLDLDQWQTILAHEFNMISELIKYIHIDNDKNRNIYIPSSKEALLLILQDQKWQLADKKDIINKMIFDKSNLIEDIIENHGNEFTKISSKRTQNILNLCITDDEEKNKIRKNVKLLFMNHSDLIKNTYEKNYNKKIKTR